MNAPPMGRRNFFKGCQYFQRAMYKQGDAIVVATKQGENAKTLCLQLAFAARENSNGDKTALQCVLEVEEERTRLEKQAEELALSETDGNKTNSAQKIKII